MEGNTGKACYDQGGGQMGAQSLQLEQREDHRLEQQRYQRQRDDRQHRTHQYRHP